MNREAGEPLPYPIPLPAATFSLGWGETPWARSAYGGQAEDQRLLTVRLPPELP